MKIEKEVRFLLPEKKPENELIPNEKDAVKTFLSNLFKEKKNGNEAMYLLLVATLKNHKEELSPEQLLFLIQGLSLFVISLDHKVHELISAVLAVNWIGESETFIACYMHFLQNLVSAQTSYVSTVTSNLIQNFVHGHSRYPTIPSEVVFDQTHRALIKILSLVPLGPSFIMPILSQYLPHKSQELPIHVFYVKCLLHMAEYLPILRNQLFALVLDLMVQIDIDIHVDDLEDVEEADDGLFEMEMELKDSFVESRESTAYSDTDSDDDDLQLAITSDSKLMMLKLDALMVIVMDYIQAKHEKAVESGDTQELTDLFDGLMGTFEKVLLPTHNLRSTQFVIFYMCSLAPDSFPEDFMGVLVAHLITFSNSSFTRMTAASYLGSFIARAKYIDLASVRKCLGLLHHQCQQYVDQHENSVRGHVEVDRFGVLYASVQAILYIFCFRWKQLMLVDDRPTSGNFPPELLGFQRILLSKFNPLRVCSEGIVQEFSRIAHQLNIMYCYPLYQSVSRAASSTDGSTLAVPSPAMNISWQTRLETLFPFDPLVLPRSKRYVEHQFQEWDGGEESEAGGSVVDPSESDLGASLKTMSLDDRLGMSMSMSVSFG
ncbi:hypothetical protein HDV03_004873 [Kappamyces sp. JEL0829]|nr:hypothetical protein HDV03_004873 [Kappamyces sp. JEL0829]